MTHVGPTAMTTAVLGAGALLVLFVWSAVVGRDDGQFVRDAHAALALHASYAKQRDRLEVAQSTHTVTMTRWRTIADTASTDSAKSEAWKAAANECRVALLACSERALLAEARVAELEPLLTRGLKIVDCHIANVHFLPRCPSRTASFLLGATLGTIGTLIVRR